MSNKFNPHVTLGSGFVPGPHWWEASALNAVPSLLPFIERANELP